MTPSGPARHEDVLAFWRDAGPDRWFKRNDDFDAQIRERFLPAYESAVAGALGAWAETPEGALALVIVLDQFPRNLFRGSAKAFASDPMARAVAGAAIARGFDRNFTPPLRRFFYLPAMHAENLADQERCIALCRAADDAEGLKYAEIHADIIRRFGRFPHRNTALGRPATAAEQAFLDAGGFSG